MTVFQNRARRTTKEQENVLSNSKSRPVKPVRPSPQGPCLAFDERVHQSISGTVSEVGGVVDGYRGSEAGQATSNAGSVTRGRRQEAVAREVFIRRQALLLTEHHQFSRIGDVRMPHAIAVLVGLVLLAAVANAVVGAQTGRVRVEIGEGRNRDRAARKLQETESSVVQEAFDSDGVSLGYSHDEDTGWSEWQIGYTADEGHAPYKYHANASY